jgi:hypothetical protein
MNEYSDNSVFTAFCPFLIRDKAHFKSPTSMVFQKMTASAIVMLIELQLFAVLTPIPPST